MQRCHAFAHLRDFEAMPCGTAVPPAPRWEAHTA